MELQIDAVHEPQRLEFVFRQLAGHPSRHLSAKFGHALGHQGAIEFVVDIHVGRSTSGDRGFYIPAGTDTSVVAGSSMVGPASLIRSRRLPGSTLPSCSSLTGAT